MRRQDPVTGGVARPMTEVQLAGDPALVDQRLSDGGEPGHRGFRDVVVTGDCQLPRYGKTPLLGGPQRAECEQVHQGTYGGQVGPTVEKCVQRIGAGVHGILRTYLDRQVVETRLRECVS